MTVGSGTATSGTDFTAVAGIRDLDPRQYPVAHGQLHADADAGHGGRAGRDGGGGRHDDGAGLLGDGRRTVAITDDDAPPTVTLSLSDASIAEDGGARR